MDDLYREIIIERHKNPLHRGSLEHANICFEDENPLCGDHIRLELRVDEDNRVVEAVFNGNGCAISTASADLLIDSIIGKTVDEVKAITKEDILDMLAIELGPVRLKCALLPLKVLKAGIYGVQQATDDLIEGEPNP